MSALSTDIFTKTDEQSHPTTTMTTASSTASSAASRMPPSSMSPSETQQQEHRHRRNRGYEDDLPQSVEEAGALLGAAITRYAVPVGLATPPKGLHSGFATYAAASTTSGGSSSSSATSAAATTTAAAAANVPSLELFQRLAQLRSLLRSAPTTTPLVAAPSLLAGVLMKLLAMSSQLAVGQVTGGGIGVGGSSSSGVGSSSSSTTAVDITQKRSGIPPMLSTPVRTFLFCS
jgi:hypothetical protein